MDTIPKTAWEAIFFIVLVLMAGNIFFVKRLVDEIDDTNRKVIVLHEKVALLGQQLDELLSKKRVTLGGPNVHTSLSFRKPTCL